MFRLKNKFSLNSLKLNKEFCKQKFAFQKVNIKNFNGMFERPTQNILVHLHSLGIIVN